MKTYIILLTAFFTTTSLFAEDPKEVIGPELPPKKEERVSVLKTDTAQKADEPPKQINLPKQADPPKQLELPRIPSTATLLALKAIEVSKTPAALLPTRRWIWLPGGSKEEAAIGIVGINIALNRSSVDYTADPIADGALLPVDFSRLADDAETVTQLLTVWDSQGELEPDFTAHVHRIVDGMHHTWNIPAPHLLEAGVQLEKLVGNTFPDRQTYLPIVKLDWFICSSLSSIDGGKYLQFRGLVVGKTKLDQYLKDHGVDEEKIKKQNSDERAACISRITGRARGINIFQSSTVKPSIGSSLIAITDDNFADRDDPTTDPFYSLLDHRPDAHEAFLTLPNGWLEFTLWNADGTLLAEAPPNVAVDRTIPDPFPTRLNGAISCMRCHGPQEMWQPFRNEVKDMLGDRVRVNTDTSGKGDIARNLRRLTSLYTGNLNPALKNARNSFDRRCFVTTGMSAKDVLLSTSTLFNSYEYANVNARSVCEEMGIVVPAEDRTGVIAFRRLIPPKSIDGSIPDDPLIGRLSTDYLDEDTGKRVGLILTRRQFSTIKVDLYDRALAAHHN